MSKTATLKKTNMGFQDQLSLNACQKYCIMLQGEHSAILSTFIKLPFVFKIFILSIFEWPLRQVLLYMYFMSRRLLIWTRRDRKKVSEYDQVMPQSHTTDQPTAP